MKIGKLLLARQADGTLSVTEGSKVSELKAITHKKAFKKKTVEWQIIRATRYVAKGRGDAGIKVEDTGDEDTMEDELNG